MLVGEIRDLETARIAAQAALTGHLLLSTLHTNDSVGAVIRLIDMGLGGLPRRRGAEGRAGAAPGALPVPGVPRALPAGEQPRIARFCRRDVFPPGRLRRVRRHRLSRPHRDRRIAGVRRATGALGRRPGRRREPAGRGARRRADRSAQRRARQGGGRDHLARRGAARDRGSSVPRFHYRALRPSGGEIAGELVAADERDAAARLQALGSYPIEITEPTGAAGPARLRRPLARPRACRQRDLILFTRQLAALIEAGVALDRGLGSDRRRPQPQRRPHARRPNCWRRSIVAKACRGPAPSCRDCRAHYAMIVAAGEARGDIGAALDRLADVLERSRATTRALLDALIYPASVFVVALRVDVVSARLCRAALRGIADQLSARAALGDAPAAAAVGGVSAGRPAACRAACGRRLVFVALRYRDPGLSAGAAPATAGPAGARPADRQARGRAAAASARQSRRRRGRTAGSARRDARGDDQRGLPRRVSPQTERGIERGDGIAVSLDAAGVLPPLAGELVRIGEETGDLAPMLLKAGDLLRREFEATSRELIGHRHAARIVVLGLLVGGVAVGDPRHGHGSLRPCSVSTGGALAALRWSNCWSCWRSWR